MASNTIQKDNISTKPATLFMPLGVPTVPEYYISVETGQSLRKRINSHRSNIMHHCNKPVANQF